MSVVFGCSSCGAPVETEPGSEVECRRCHATSSLKPAAEQLEGCLACECDELYRHRDFNQKLGIFLILVGIVLSLTLSTFWPLLIAAVVDFVLWRILPDVAICYACKAHHRDLSGLKRIKPFDLERHEHHRFVKAREEGKIPPRTEEG